jgi:16S rRNA (cytosine1402-N4)-methyltransferase
VDGILADLGVSSYQFDTGERGFSTRFDGPLDMRMDHRSELTAAAVLQTYTEAKLHLLFERYGELRNAKQLAKHIATQRPKAAINTTQDLKAFLEPVIKGNPQRYLAQLFQALRIEVNDELGALRELLEQSAQCLKPGGRLSIISFHSLEDRLVKQFVKNGAWQIEEDPLGLAPKMQSPFKEVYKKPIEASAEELAKNPRSRSARLRIAEKN